MKNGLDLSSVLLPKKNHLIPENFDIKSKEIKSKNEKPSLIKTENPNFKFYWQQDQVF